MMRTQNEEGSRWRHLGSAEQKRELWQRWKAGESLTEIGRALGKHSSSTHKVPELRRREKDRDEQREHVKRERTEEDVCHRSAD